MCERLVCAVTVAIYDGECEWDGCASTARRGDDRSFLCVCVIVCVLVCVPDHCSGAGSASHRSGGSGRGAGGAGSSGPSSHRDFPYDFDDSSTDSDEVEELGAPVPGGRPDPDTRTAKQRALDQRQARDEAAAMTRSRVTADGDDLLRNGRSGGVKGPGKGGYKGGKPGQPLQGGDGSELFGSGGGGGMFGGGGGGYEGAGAVVAVCVWLWWRAVVVLRCSGCLKA